MLHRRIAHCASLAACLVVATGCASNPGTTQAVPTTAQESTSAPDPGASSRAPSPSPSQQNQNQIDEPVAFVPWGPADPVIPQHYGKLARRDCAGAQETAPSDAFWQSVLAVCRAMTQGTPMPDLTDVPPVPQTDSPHEQCLDAELGQMVSGAVEWRAQHSDAIPEVVFANTGSPCYLRIYSARQVPASQDSTNPGAAQVTLELLSDSTYHVTGVRVDGKDVDPDDYFSQSNEPFSGMRTQHIHVPAPATPSQVNVEMWLDLDGSPQGKTSVMVDVAPINSESPATDNGTEGESSPP